MTEILDLFICLFLFSFPSSRLLRFVEYSCGRIKITLVILAVRGSNPPVALAYIQGLEVVYFVGHLTILFKLDYM
jgi:hypothetical protein